MKKLLYVSLFIVIFFSTILLTFASGLFQIKNITYDRLSFDLYSSLSSSNSDPIFSLSEINQQVDKIPEALRPLFKMILKQTPRPKNGINVKVHSKSYTIHFKNESDWKFFKKTLIKVIDLKAKSNHQSQGILKVEAVE